ncbi:MAG: hypothetical protein OEY36_03080 [Gammaproteobacteria bacterium]|nr:hypothetical protein [Gammaproteobacteria bacterium]
MNAYLNLAARCHEKSNVLLTALLVLSPFAVFAADPVFTFAPPPVSYDAGKGTQRFTYVSADFGSDTLTGLGTVVTTKEDASNSWADAKDTPLSAMFLASDSLEMAVLEAGWKSEYHLDNIDLAFYHSINTGFNFLNIDLGMPNSYSHTWVFPLILTAGVQTKIALSGNTIITPYAYALMNASSTSNETDMGDLNPAVSTTDSFTSTGIVYGLDIFLDGVSLSAMITDSENDMLMISVGFPTE